MSSYRSFLVLPTAIICLAQRFFAICTCKSPIGPVPRIVIFTLLKDYLRSRGWLKLPDKMKSSIFCLLSKPVIEFIIRTNSAMLLFFSFSISFLEGWMKRNATLPCKKNSRPNKSFFNRNTLFRHGFEHFSRFLSPRNRAKWHLLESVTGVR